LARRARVSAAAFCCWSARSPRTSARSSALATTVTALEVTNARSTSRTKVPTGMCSMVRLAKRPTITAGGRPRAPRRRAPATARQRLRDERVGHEARVGVVPPAPTGR
jgi:hypothetical protein